MPMIDVTPPANAVHSCPTALFDGDFARGDGLRSLTLPARLPEPARLLATAPPRSGAHGCDGRRSAPGLDHPAFNLDRYTTLQKLHFHNELELLSPPENFSFEAGQGTTGYLDECPRFETFLGSQWRIRRNQTVYPR